MSLPGLRKKCANHLYTYTISGGVRKICLWHFLVVTYQKFKHALTTAIENVKTMRV